MAYRAKLNTQVWTSSDEPSLSTSVNSVQLHTRFLWRNFLELVWDKSCGSMRVKRNQNQRQIGVPASRVVPPTITPSHQTCLSLACLMELISVSQPAVATRDVNASNKEPSVSCLPWCSGRFAWCCDDRVCPQNTTGPLFCKRTNVTQKRTTYHAT